MHTRMFLLLQSKRIIPSQKLIKSRSILQIQASLLLLLLLLPLLTLVRLLLLLPRKRRRRRSLQRSLMKTWVSVFLTKLCRRLQSSVFGYQIESFHFSLMLWLILFFFGFSISQVTNSRPYLQFYIEYIRGFLQS
ncbi:hypothetical protein CDL12_02365 [Handroanthus impetiginosus]|uniref:Uncharacterized protein n=1 Tax=Handroanthus impetiginosus TaxID=429701 RepID=A0A2G9I5K9_9LAMI|nr:hypothetical protein CDL12_02365 [Handroanthus impetiginosus]